MSDIKQKVTAKAKQLLSQGKVAGVIGLKQDGEDIGPYLFQKAEELDSLNLGDKNAAGDSRYSLVRVLYELMKRFPRDRFGIILRGCDERAMWRLVAEDRACPIRADHVDPIGFSCPPELAEACRCAKPWPNSLVAGEQTPGVAVGEPKEAKGDLMAQLKGWLAINDRCIKCLGCKTICPVCVCNECTVEQEHMVPQRQLPPEPSFLLTRAVHMVDRCVYCGLCEQACPAEIPLKDLYRLVSKMTGRGVVLPGLGDAVPAFKKAAQG